MEAFRRGPGRVKGIEILFFEEAEIEKSKGNDTSFAASGPLSILYFKEYSRFVLRLNDWRYPLMKRLNISSSSVKDDPSSRTYVLPAPNGFSFVLKINKVAYNQAFENFETILDHSSRFSVFGKEIPYRKLEPSPDDKLARSTLLTTNPKEVISETVKKVIQKVQNKTATLKTGTKYLTSTKRKVNLKDIKNKNFKKEAKSTFKKDFFESNQKICDEFLQRRKTNPNLSQAKDFDDLKKTSDSQAPSLFIFKEDLEEAILNNKEIFSYLNQPEKIEEKRGLMTNLRDGARNIRNRVSNIMNRERNMVTPGVLGETAKDPISDTHYQG